MNENIATQNAQRLAHLSSIFCIVNGLPANNELCRAIAEAVMANIAKWYNDNGRTFNPQTELICDDAIKAAFERVQQIAALASMAAQLGIGMDTLNGLTS